MYRHKRTNNRKTHAPELYITNHSANGAPDVQLVAQPSSIIQYGILCERGSTAPCAPRFHPHSRNTSRSLLTVNVVLRGRPLTSPLYKAKQVILLNYSFFEQLSVLVHSHRVVATTEVPTTPGASYRTGEGLPVHLIVRVRISTPALQNMQGARAVRGRGDTRRRDNEPLVLSNIPFSVDRSPCSPLFSYSFFGS